MNKLGKKNQEIIKPLFFIWNKFIDFLSIWIFRIFLHFDLQYSWKISR